MRLATRGTSILLGLTLAACGGGGGGGGGGNTLPPATPTPMPTGGASLYACPSSATTFTAQIAGGSSAQSAQRVSIRQAPQTGASAQLLEVSYASGRGLHAPLEQRIASLGGMARGEMHFNRIGRSAQIVAVDPSRIDAVEATLRAEPGVIVSRAARRYALTSTPLETNDPIFDGTGVPPLYETAAQRGQWDMHIIGLDYAFGYSKTGNTVAANPNALGSTAVRLAVIDTGMDVTQPDLADAHIVKTQCYITDPNGNASSGSYVTDPDGHGTDVTSIAAAAVNDGHAFAGAAGNVSLLLYRVFPTPNSTCDTVTGSTANPPPQCSASGTDIASAINDAVASGANVISMSFGGGTCSAGGVDPDTLEGDAVANAIANNVIVVAAAGNSGGGALAAPGCDTGVIAVGASAYNDGVPNGSGYTGANTEYVTSYSQYGATNSLHSASSWGIVAPGGDGASTSDQDDLHWIENAWTSTPFEMKDAANCTPVNGANSCRVLIDGTSQATPHVAGAAALILSVSTVYQLPSAMKQLLCSNSDDIGAAHQGCGRLNLYRAMAKALRDPSPP